VRGSPALLVASSHTKGKETSCNKLKSLISTAAPDLSVAVKSSPTASAYRCRLLDASARAAHDALAAKYGAFGDAGMKVIDAYGMPAGYKRGYAFTDTTSATRPSQDAAVQAYNERTARLQNAWRKDRQADDADRLSTQDARAIADASYAAKKQRLSNGWRNR
jgi:hypothetical protein